MIARGRTWKTSFEPTLERRKVNRMERHGGSRDPKNRKTLNDDVRREKLSFTLTRLFDENLLRKACTTPLKRSLTREDAWRGLKKRCLYSDSEFQGIVDISGRKIFVLFFSVDGFDWIFKELSFLLFFLWEMNFFFSIIWLEVKNVFEGLVKILYFRIIIAWKRMYKL